MKKILLSLFITLLFTANASAETLEIDESLYEVEIDENCLYENPNYCGNNSLTNGLDSNQTTLFYMYSNEYGHYFLDPLAEYENIIYVGLDDFYINANVQHGKRYIGTFADSSLWELVDIQEVKN